MNEAEREQRWQKLPLDALKAEFRAQYAALQEADGFSVCKHCTEQVICCACGPTMAFIYVERML